MRLLIAFLLIGGYALVACGLYVVAYVIGQSTAGAVLAIALMIWALARPQVRAEAVKLWKQITGNM
jgi:hypothetical protein